MSSATVTLIFSSNKYSIRDQRGEAVERVTLDDLDRAAEELRADPYRLLHALLCLGGDCEHLSA